MRLRKKPNLAARMERLAHLIISDPAALRGIWARKFGYEMLYVEIGCGKGQFTVETASQNPDILFIGLEKTGDAMINAVESAHNEGLKNLRFINANADNFSDYFAENEILRIYINFCDPWPSNRHIKRRLTSGRFLQMYKNALCSKGQIRFKTDNLPLFEYSLREFEFCGFSTIKEVRDLHKNGPVGVMTDYERKFYGMGLPIYAANAEKL